MQSVVTDTLLLESSCIDILELMSVVTDDE